MYINDKNLIILIHPGSFALDTPYVPFESIFLAKFLEKSGYEVKIIDQRVENEWEVALIKYLDSALWVGLTVITGPQISFALNTASKIRQFRPSIPIVWGGWHSTFLSRQTILHPLVDYVVIGIGELRVRQLSEYIRNGNRDISLIPGVINKDYPLNLACQKDLFGESDDLPAYHLIDIERYRSSNNWAAMITARGCLYRCAFCNIAQTLFINRPIEAVLNELEYLVSKKGFSLINFADGLFFLQKKRVLKLMDEIEKRGIHFKWKASVRADTFQRYPEDEIERFIKLGLVAVNTGLESGSPGMLKRIQKGCTIEDAFNLVKVTAKYKIQLTVSFLCGLPYETIDDLLLTIQHCHQLFEQNPNIRILNPFYMPIPGAVTYDWFVETGWTPPISLEEWAEAVDYRIAAEEVKPFPWMNHSEFDKYMNIYQGSILNLKKEKNLLGRQ